MSLPAPASSNFKCTWLDPSPIQYVMALFETIISLVETISVNSGTQSASE